MRPGVIAVILLFVMATVNGVFYGFNPGGVSRDVMFWLAVANGAVGMVLGNLLVIDAQRGKCG